MKIVVTVDEIMDKNTWDKFCDIKGINPYAVAEGLMDEDEEVSLTPEEALCLGFTLCNEEVE